MTGLLSDGRAVWGVIPVKSFRAAKTRLSGTLSRSEREDLARDMFHHVFNVLINSELEGVLVATDCPEIERWSRNAGARVIRDPPGDDGRPLDLGQVVDAALGRLGGMGIDLGMIVMADLPLIVPEDIGIMMRAMEDHDVIIAPDRRGLGTNVLCTNVNFPTHFGQGDSARRHREQALERKLRVSMFRTPTLALDIDHPGDYRYWLESPRR